MAHATLTYSSIRGTRERRRLIRFSSGLFIGSLTWPIFTALAWMVAVSVADNPRFAYVRHRPRRRHLTARRRAGSIH